MDRKWVWIGLGLGALYLIGSSQSALINTLVLPANASLPMSNKAGDQFSCPTGTIFTEIPSSVNGSGYCS